MRSNGCGDLREQNIDQQVQLCGWVDRRRDHGGVIFIDLRDRSGTVQITVDPDLGADAFACLLYTSPSPRDYGTSRMPSSA